MENVTNNKASYQDIDPHDIGWMLDGEIHLGQVFGESNMHLGTMERLLRDKGLTARDASCFAQFVFAEHATSNGGMTDGKSEDYVNDEQLERLEVV